LHERDWAGKHGSSIYRRATTPATMKAAPERPAALAAPAVTTVGLGAEVAATTVEVVDLTQELLAEGVEQLDVVLVHERVVTGRVIVQGQSVMVRVVGAVTG